MKSYECKHCGQKLEANDLPIGWQVSRFQDCQSDLYYCPACQQAEADLCTAWDLVWNDPAANQRHGDFDAWLTAMVPLARFMGYIGQDEGVEALRAVESWQEAFAQDDTPAQAMVEDLSYAC